MFFNLSIINIDVGKALEQAYRTIFGLLCVPVYNLIEIFYNLFTKIARFEFLNDEIVLEIYRKVGLILGIFMVFKLIFSLITALIDPSKLNDKKSGFGSIIFRSIISIVLIGITPTIFKEAINVQNLIIGGEDGSNNVIYKLIIGSNDGFQPKTFGRKLAVDLYFSFFTKNSESDWPEGKTWNDNRLVSSSYDGIKESTEDGDVGYGNLVNTLYEVDNNGNYLIEFDGLLCFIVGLAMAYLLLQYCIQISIRVFQLAYLQLIAPVPILSYISDPEGSFKKWIKQCTTTFLDLFIRMAILYLIIYFANDVINLLSVDTATENLNLGIKIFLLIGLFLFGKRVPELLKDLFPNMGGGVASLSMGLKSPKKLWQEDLSKTPIGWGTKAIGWTGKKVAGFYDRKKYNLPKPRNKFEQSLDKLMPGRAEAIKNRNAAEANKIQFNRYMSEGKKIYTDFGEDLVLKDDNGNITGVKPKVFHSKDYESTYLNLERAKADYKKSEQEYQTEYAKYQAAYSKGDQAEITLAEERIKIANKNKSIAQGKMDFAQKQHDDNKNIYKDDAEREEKYDYYKKTHGQLKEYPNASQPSSQPNEQPQPQQSETLEEQRDNAQKDLYESIGRGEDPTVAQQKMQKFIELDEKVDAQNEQEAEQQTNIVQQSTPSIKVDKKQLAAEEAKLKKMLLNEVDYTPNEILEQSKKVEKMKQNYKNE